jgi:Tol biopolymer transport system component/DNA-binding winged helix-turn-helix (wHTH) protein
MLATSTDTSQAPFYVGDWLVEPALRQVSRATATKRLEPRVMDVLLCLAAKPGAVVSREQLEHEVWGGAYIGQDALNRSVSKLRHLLDDDPQSPSVIETIPKAGYRLIAPVRHTGHAYRAPKRRVSLVAAAGLVALLAVPPILRVARPSATPAAEPRVAAPLTSRPGYESSPSFAASGTHLVFQSYDLTATDPKTWDLYIKSTDGEGAWIPFAATASHEFSAAWSPVADSIAYVKQSPGTCGVYLGAALGGRHEKLLDCAADSYYVLAWTADGDGLALASLAGDRGGIRLYRRSTGRVADITNPPSNYVGDGLLALSPDGERMAFVRTKIEGVDDLYLVELDHPERIVRLTHENRRINGVAWSADGHSLLFTSHRGGNSQLWEIDGAGGEPWQIPISGRHASRIAVSVDGTVVYEEYTGDINIWTRPLTADGTLGTPTRLTTSTRSDWAGRSAPDDLRMAFVSDRSGAPEIWLTRPDSSAPQRLTHLEAAVVGAPRWAPDGETIVFEAAVADHTDIYTVRPSTNETLRIIADPADDRAPSWSRDGRSVYFASNRTGEWQVWRRPLDPDGKAEQVTRAGGFSATETWDADAILFTKADQPGLWRMAVSGGYPELVWDAVQPADWNNWIVHRKSIGYFRVSGAERATFETYDLVLRQERGLGTEDREITANSGLSISSDGTRWTYATVDRSESDLWRLEPNR